MRCILHIGAWLATMHLANMILKILKSFIAQLNIKNDNAGLTKKDLPRGKWRYLKDFELVRLLGQGKKKKAKR